MATVLLIEDDEAIAGPVARAIEREGHRALRANDGPSGVSVAASAGPDLVILDLGLPGFDGLEVCRRIRATDRHVPIMMLTARADEIDTVVGLDAGADDYVTKPFRVAELMARIRALLRRSQALPDQSLPTLEAANLRVDLAARRVWIDGQEIELSPKEHDLLVLLMRNAGKAITREEIIAEVWDENWFGSTKTLDQHISWVRRKLSDDPASPTFITTIRGVGYRFEPETSEISSP